MYMYIYICICIYMYVYIYICIHSLNIHQYISLLKLSVVYVWSIAVTVCTVFDLTVKCCKDDIHYGA